jgi:hypothetical protein
MADKALDDFLTSLSVQPIDRIVSHELFERVPVVFAGDANAHIEWKHELSKRIDVDARALCLVGSSVSGISLNPRKKYKKFDNNSDIDVAAISDHHFDLAWNWMRNISSAEWFKLSKSAQASIDEHKTRLIYYGTIATDQIVQFLPFGKRWVTGLAEVQALAPINGRTVKVRLYRDFGALRSYHVSNLKKLRDTYLASA